MNYILKNLLSEFGHAGVRKTWFIFEENCYSNQDLGIAKKIINNCRICHIYKYKNFVNNKVPRNIKNEKRLQTICIDFIEELTITDWCKKYILHVRLFATKSTKVHWEIKIQIYVLMKVVNQSCILDNATY